MSGGSSRFRTHFDLFVRKISCHQVISEKCSWKTSAHFSVSDYSFSCSDPNHNIRSYAPPLVQPWMKHSDQTEEADIQMKGGFSCRKMWICLTLRTRTHTQIYTFYPRALGEPSLKSTLFLLDQQTAQICGSCSLVNRVWVNIQTTEHEKKTAIWSVYLRRLCDES